MKRILSVFAAVFVSGALALAAVPPIPVSPTFSEASQIVATLNFLINSINTNITPTTMGQFNSNSRNILDNGALEIQQRGTGVITCAANAAITSAAYGADRWGCSANVAVGAGRQQVITSTPTPFTGFKSAMTLFRTSGALTQPICTWQEIPTADVLKLSGQQVVLSTYMQALAGMAADNGAVANLVIITGTGTDEGFGTMTASPAITPAWTGIATLVNTATPALSATVWSRPQTTAVVASTVTEMAVGFCFTPTATGAGATDGFAWTGAQLEVVGSPTAAASTFSFKGAAYELRQAQRFFYRINESAAIFNVGACWNPSVTVSQCFVKFPETMFKAPTMTYTAGFAVPTTVAGGTLGACTGLATSTNIASTAPGLDGVLVQCTATTVPAAGTANMLYSNGGAGVITASADF